ncbi:MAG TPA: hypothetical protein VGP89_18165 [Candidatus Angelobacter sp.]|jgi:hypothetical protein|nr:hypothetical protein [Candidatus Angelobacter sp.]
MTQQYFCPDCRYSGAVEHGDHDGVFDVLYKLEGDHRTNSPNCETGYRGLRVRNVEMCSEQEWAALVNQVQPK